MRTPKSAIRSAAAASRRADRTYQRQVRECVQRYKLQLQHQDMQQMEEAVQDYNDYLSILRNVHRKVQDPVDWEAISKEPAVQEPIRHQFNELLAYQELEAYKPSFLDKLFKTQQKRRVKLRQEIAYARVRDQRRYENSLVAYLQSCQQYLYMQQLASGIRNGDVLAFEESLVYFNPFCDIKELGSQVDLSFQKDQVTVTLQVNCDDIIPDYILSLAGQGRLAKKEMAVSKFNELYYGYVCSCVLRIIGELFALLPLQVVLIHAVAPVLNAATCRMEEKPVLSVAAGREAWEGLQLNAMEPADILRLFPHHMRFSKMGGFTEVALLEAHIVPRN